MLGLTAIQTGLAFLPQTFMMALGSTQAAKVVGRLGVRTTLTVGFTLAALGLAGLTSSDASEKSAMPATNMRLRPSRSPARPPSSSSPPNVSV